jgi:hypothetical protein
MQRNSSFFPPFALLLALGALGACSDGGGGKKEPLDAGDDGGEAVVDEPDASEEGDSEAPCVPKGCDEQGFECGTAEDGCGNPLDCTGVKECEFPEVCGADNRCGCTPKTCDELSAGAGAQACGTVSDGCGGQIECAGCDGFDGERWTCSAGYCECPAVSKEAACAARECGAVADGCGGDLDCGSCASPARGCSDAGACACKSNAEYATTACAGKTCGTVTVDGCAFDCGGACGNTCASGAACSACECPGGSQCGSAGTCCTPSSQAALCAQAECGAVVTDTCTGTSYTCGCSAGTTCVDKLYIQNATKNSCVADAQARILGGYVVRAHSFQEFVGGLQRAETVSRVRVVQTAGGLRLEDTGCVATTLSETGLFGSSTPVRSVARAYTNIPSLVASFTSDGATFARTAATREPAGFWPGLPPYCDGTSTTPVATANQADFAAIPSALNPNQITPDSGSDKEWLPRACTCPRSANVCTGEITAGCMPAAALNTTGSTDCRVNDVDNDTLPGFSVITSAAGSTFAAGVSAGRTVWNGVVSSTGFHTAQAPADKGAAQAFVYCSGFGCLGISNNATVRPCRPEFNPIQFAPLTPAEDRAFSCSTLYNTSLATLGTATQWDQVSNAVKQSAIEAYFNGQLRALPTCGSGNSCPTGMLCKSGSCYPKTSAAACTDNAECGEGWKCLNGACWPTGITSCEDRTTP